MELSEMLIVFQTHTAKNAFKFEVIYNHKLN